MKTNILCLLGLSMAASLHAATWTVDNNHSRPANFRTIQEAVDAAAVGDTILIATSSTEYSGFTLRKRLNLVGPGNTATGGGAAEVSYVDIRSVEDVLSPDLGQNAGASRIEGLTVRELSISSDCSNVLINRCSISSSLSTKGDHSLILSCWSSGTAYTDLYIGGANSMVIGSKFNSINISKENVLVENCIFTKQESSSFHPYHPPLIRNTILIHQSSGTGTYSGATFDHCLSLGDRGLPEGNGNINLIYAHVENIFVDYGSGAAAGLRLKEGSLAIGAGRDGVDMGIFAGSAPYIPGIVPALPRITELRLPVTVPDSTGLTFEVKAEARD